MVVNTHWHCDHSGGNHHFQRKYGVKTLVWFEQFGDIGEAILREKRLKRWRRAWKIELIEAGNPGWRDLFEEVNVA